VRREVHSPPTGEDPCGLDEGVMKYAWLSLLHDNKAKREAHKGDIEKKDAVRLAGRVE
jgi:hypothetical protein